VATECGTVSERNVLMEKTEKYNIVQTKKKKSFRIGEEIKYAVTGKGIAFLKEKNIDATERHLCN